RSCSTAVTFPLLMGASQGVLTFVGGAWPLPFLGGGGYGAALGVLAIPVLLATAAPPAIFAWIVDRWGWGFARMSLLVCCSAAYLAMEFMSRWYERRREIDDAGTHHGPARLSRSPRERVRRG